MIDIKMNYNKLLKLSNDKIIEVRQKLFSERELYKISLGWRHNKELILKSRGLQGDVIVGWRGVEY